MKSSPTHSRIPVYVIALLILALGISSLSLILHFSGNHSSKIVYVDAIKLLNNYVGMKEARKEFELKVSAVNSNLDTLKAELDQKTRDYQTRQAKLSSTEKALLEELIAEKKRQFEAYQQAASETVGRQDQEMTKKVYDRVNDFIKQYAIEKGYTYVLSANQYGAIVYAEDAVDITDEVVALLNTEYAK